jgi:uncharacterized protein (DUF433 family)
MASKVAEAKIINRGRGPEISGTRITVYDVMDYYKDGWHRDRIAALFRLSSGDIQEAIDYIEAHKEEVEREYQKILDRHRNYKNPPRFRQSSTEFAAQRGNDSKKPADAGNRRIAMPTIMADHDVAGQLQVLP